MKLILQRYIRISGPIMFLPILVFYISMTGAAAGKYKKSLATSYVQGELLVKYKPGYRHLASENYSKKGISRIRSFPSINTELVKLPRELTIENALIIYANDRLVEYAEPNYYRYAEKIIPNDTFYDALWGLNNTGRFINGTDGIADWDIDAPEAWALSTGNPDIIIAVIDSGIDRHHPDLIENIWSNPLESPDNQVDDDQNGLIDDVYGWNFLNDSPDIFDQFNHGTLVSGILAAVGNNNHGTVGVCWQASIMALKFMDQYGIGNIADSIAAIEYACAHGAKIINASYGDITYSELEYQAILAARKQGILFITAAGNNGIDNDIAGHYPSGYPLDNIIAVAASDSNRQLAAFSNYGATSVDVVAPGVEIYAPSILFFVSIDFESALEDWQLDEPWKRTIGQAYSGKYSLTDSPQDLYSSRLNSSATSPAMDFSEKNNIMLMFMIKGQSQKNRDLLWVETATHLSGPWQSQPIMVNDKGAFPNGLSGIIKTWKTAMVEFKHLDGETVAYFRFRFETDTSTVNEGWYIDQITLSASETSGATYPEENYYQYLSGTSAATPFVSGLAALLWSYKPDLTFTEVKTYIIKGASDGDFEGKILSGGQINAYNSLKMVDDDSSSPCFVSLCSFL